MQLINNEPLNKCNESTMNHSTNSLNKSLMNHSTKKKIRIQIRPPQIRPQQWIRIAPWEQLARPLSRLEWDRFSLWRPLPSQGPAHWSPSDVRQDGFLKIQYALNTSFTNLLGSEGPYLYFQSDHRGCKDAIARRRFHQSLKKHTMQEKFNTKSTSHLCNYWLSFFLSLASPVNRAVEGVEGIDPISADIARSGASKAMPVFVCRPEVWVSNPAIIRSGSELCVGEVANLDTYPGSVVLERNLRGL